MSTSPIHIPHPCHEDWNKMQQREQGRHCLSCCKTVVDFTGWETEAISTYLQANAGHKVCGRFTAQQLAPAAESPSTHTLVKHIEESNLSFLKKIAAVIITVFALTATSCNTTPTTGQIVPDSLHANTKDTIAVIQDPIMGDIRPIPPSDTAAHICQPIADIQDAPLPHLSMLPCHLKSLWVNPLFQTVSVRNGTPPNINKHKKGPIRISALLLFYNPP
ncbi:hypothetical protein SAMN05421788_11590 [Filimonas lacunae]|uniref:Uncharacterized protein n=1 Tax=Filimonas lacunae TaxID=477680 RepID=A0A173MC62_9BACT|nr:hypothetical protein [Filimonas lacunae]BAV05069.1 hypothetical protein FLA_1075 [Filimonas lacunae]SIT34278.1 hypothetical protein SAMN05421788_11590 [Filimonas lacunae]